MKFKVATGEYEVIITPGALYGDEGEEQLGRCCWSGSTIEISGTLAEDRRLNTLLHELRHLWVWHIGRQNPADEEDDANNTATFATEMMRQLNAQGGEIALRAMKPSKPPIDICTTSFLTFATRNEDGGTECGECGSSIGPQRIVTSFDMDAPCTRAVYCAFCHRVQLWHEKTNSDGLPNGEIVGQLAIYRGTDATEWLRRHGEQIGILMIGGAR